MQKKLKKQEKRKEKAAQMDIEEESEDDWFSLCNQINDDTVELYTQRVRQHISTS